VLLISCGVQVVEDTTFAMAGIQAQQWEHEKSLALQNAEGACAKALDFLRQRVGAFDNSHFSTLRIKTLNFSTFESLYCKDQIWLVDKHCGQSGAHTHQLQLQLHDPSAIEFEMNFDTTRMARRCQR
jgi:hypothetical protein